MCLADTEVCDVFYQVALPPGLAEHFGLPGIQASALNLSSIGDLPTTHAAIVTPMLKVIPTGWSWIVYFTHALLESSAARGKIAIPRLHSGKRVSGVHGTQTTFC